jgi:hypothetical protein
MKFAFRDNARNSGLHDSAGRKQIGVKIGRVEIARRRMARAASQRHCEHAYCGLHEPEMPATEALVRATGLSGVAKLAMAQAVSIAEWSACPPAMHTAAFVRHRGRFARRSSPRLGSATGAKRHSKPARIIGFLTVHGIEPRFRGIAVGGGGCAHCLSPVASRRLPVARCLMGIMRAVWEVWRNGLCVFAVMAVLSQEMHCDSRAFFETNFSDARLWRPARAYPVTPLFCQIRARFQQDGFPERRGWTFERSLSCYGKGRFSGTGET